MEEIWKDINGYEGLYQINKAGEVKSFQYDPAGRVMSIVNGVKGYKQILLASVGSRKRFYIHRLVAITFIENPNNLSQVNHKDGDKSNNHVSNLEWCSQSSNIIHAYKSGLYKKGPGSKGVEWSKKVRNIETNEIFISVKAASISIGVKYKTLASALAEGKTYKSLRYL